MEIIKQKRCAAMKYPPVRVLRAGFVGRKTLSDDRFRSLEDEPGDLSCGESGGPVFPFGTCHESCMERAIRQRQPLRAPESDPLQSTFQSRNSLGCKQFRFRIETFLYCDAQQSGLQSSCCCEEVDIRASCGWIRQHSVC